MTGLPGLMVYLARGRIAARWGALAFQVRFPPKDVAWPPLDDPLLADSAFQVAIWIENIVTGLDKHRPYAEVWDGPARVGGEFKGTALPINSVAGAVRLLRAMAAKCFWGEDG